MEGRKQGRPEDGLSLRHDSQLYLINPESPIKATITGYDVKETRLLAAAFVSSIGHDKYDYALMFKLTGFTESTSKKFWPVVKKKVKQRNSGAAA
ncbi:hypothetical protein E8E13_010213 [Curvularia kusanoi]|uniref:Uncharacterized protein n=1 Tax=Curvularia kusanoi TaxID=90978 RepID=A0A9P4TJU3_CURKU|nr:hypothetical protein E8E13_010213 [Curvularia kusanoi]